LREAVDDKEATPVGGKVKCLTGFKLIFRAIVKIIGVLLIAWNSVLLLILTEAGQVPLTRHSIVDVSEFVFVLLG